MKKRGMSTTDAIWLLVGMVAVAVIVVVGYNYYGELEEEDIPGNVTNMTNQTVEDSCILTNAIWGADYVFIDEEVTLTVFGEDCDGEDLRVEIFDSSDEPVNEVEGIQLENGIAIMEWEAGSEWEGGIYLLLIPILTIYVMGTYRVRTMRHYEMFFLIVTIIVIVGLLLAFSSRVQYQPVVEETYYFTAVLESNSSMFVQSPELDVGEQVIPESCGNGIIEGGEECDDGNSDNNDECLNSCLLASCGDGLVWDGEEECDDGDSDNSDQCLNSCQLASCGDGIVQQGVEECDDGNDVNSDECTNSCEVAICGDGIVQQGVEECDDGNDIDTDLCSNSCVGQQEILWPPEQEPEMTYTYSWTEVNDGLGIDNIVKMRHVGILSPGPNYVEGLQQDFSEQPEGHRVMLLRSYSYAHEGEPNPNQALMHRHPDDGCIDEDGNIAGAINDDGEYEEFKCIWWTNGVAQAKDMVDDFFSALSSSGVEIDIVILDSEKWLGRGSIANNMNSDYDNQNWQAIEDDERFSGEEENISQMLLDLGFDPEDARINDTVLFWKQWAICDHEQFDCKNNWLRWAGVTRPKVAQYINYTIYDSASQYYPDIEMSDYNHYHYSQEYPIPGKNGGPDLDIFGGVSHVVGTHQASEQYGRIAFSLSLPEEPYLQPEPYNAFRYEVNKARAMYLSNPEVPAHSWIGRRNWGFGSDIKFAGTDFYNEMTLHMPLTGTEILYFNAGAGGDPETYDENDVLMSETLHEIDDVLNYQGVTKTPLFSDLSPWDKDYVYTGMEILTDSGDFKVWRFTPKIEEGQTIDDFIISSGNTIEGSDVVFEADGDTITFPDAYILEPENPVSPDFGAWVIQGNGAGMPDLS